MKEKSLLPQSYTIEQIDSLAKSMDIGAFGMMMDARVREFDKQQKRTFVEIGYICLKVEQTEAWRSMFGGKKFKSFGAWITDAAPTSRATAYASMGEVKKAIEDGLSLQELNQMPRCNIKTVNRLSTSLKKNPDIIEAAKKLPENEFLKKIEEQFPEQHIESKLPMRFKPDRSQRRTVDVAIQAAMMIYETNSREDALEKIAMSWLEAHKAELERFYAETVTA